MVDGKRVCNEGAINIAIEATVAQPLYHRDYHGLDIAVLKLIKPVPYNGNQFSNCIFEDQCNQTNMKSTIGYFKN